MTERSIRYQRSDRAIFTVVDDEVVALDVDAGQCYGFNSSASQVWQLLGQPRSIDEICSLLQPAFEVDQATCRRDVEELVDSLLRDGMVRHLDPGD